MKSRHRTAIALIALLALADLAAAAWLRELWQRRHSRTEATADIGWAGGHGFEVQAGPATADKMSPR